jgi:hypothetical protein
MGNRRVFNHLVVISVCARVILSSTQKVQSTALHVLYQTTRILDRE